MRELFNLAVVIVIAVFVGNILFGIANYFLIR